MSAVDQSKDYVEYGTRPFRAILLSLFLAGFAIFSSLYCVQPMMPFLAKFFHVSATQSSFPLSFSTSALALGVLFAGVISDRYGRKNIMVFALFSTALLLLLSVAFPRWEIFLATRLVLGMAVSGVASVAMTYIGEEISQKDVGFAMGLYISGTAIGGMSGRLIAGVLLDFTTWQIATLLIGVINIAIATIFYLALPASRHFVATRLSPYLLKKAFQNTLADRRLGLLFLQGFILMGCFVSVFNYMSYHLLEQPIALSQTWIGLISVAYLSGIYSSPRAAAWSRKYGRDRVIFYMLLAMLLGLWVMRSEILVFILLGLVIFTFSFFAAHSTASSWVSVQALQYRAVAASLYLFCYYLGSSLLGSASGLVWEQWGWLGIQFEISIFLLIGLYAAYHLRQPQQA
ncbi:MFS transporter [Acinetobacter rudis]|uniref:MFS transporter, YNFM family, membrane transporter n=1 Tax=Acinetobacter rudis CIP 110305 TaxID=421052 RepID=S3PS44_9GAMM|nr:MFS transporter [Acinetobacter rudis]EPF81581.1 MFS transporter, YNFM family, membrane transporter [Acinetobacter rudis CIP 110305]